MWVWLENFFPIVGLLSLQIIIFGSNHILAIPIDNELILKPRPQPGSGGVRTECRPGTTDLLFVIDGSTSIGPRNFELMRQFLGNVVSDLPPGSKVAAVQFSGTVRTEFSFKTHATKDDAEAALRRLPYLRGTTKIGQALEYTLRRELTEAAGDRLEVPNIVITITDGRSTDDVDDISNRLRATGAKTIAIGVTNLVEDNQLISIAGAMERVFKIEDFTKLDQVLQDAITSTQLCVQVTVAPRFTEPSLDIRCGPDSIFIGSETKNPFEGQVYVKGHYNNPECVSEGDGRSFAGITVPFDACDTVRRRSINPRGVFVETTVIFKFHPTFLTKVDRAFRIQCFYMEADKTVTSDVEVSMLTTLEATQQFPMPVCSYSVHLGSPEGPPVRFAVVGQPAYHVWECDNAESDLLFRMRVHSCYVDDTQGNRVNLLDEVGCTLDKFLLQNLDYDRNNMRATVEAHVFKFADKPQLYFQCQVSLCVDLEGGCDNFPPQCPDVRKKRHTNNPWLQNDTITMDVITAAIQVADQSDLQPLSYALETREEISLELDMHALPVCLTQVEVFLFALLSLGSFILISAVSVAVHTKTSNYPLMLW